jgi:hypothetical protein
MGCICVGNKKIAIKLLTKNNTINYELIDNNIWKKIFIFLPKKNLNQVLRTNKKFYNIIKELLYEELKNETEDKTILTLKENTNKLSKKEESNIELNKISINQNKKIKKISPVIITKTEPKDNQNKIDTTYIDVFTYMKITINPKPITNEQNRNSSVSSSISFNNNKTPSFSDDSNHKSLANVSLVSNNVNKTSNSNNKLSKFKNISIDDKNLEVSDGNK